MIPAFLLTGSLDLELLMSRLERVPKPIQAGDNSPVWFQIQGMMHDRKTPGCSFSLNNLDIYWFSLSNPYFYLVPTFYFLSVTCNAIKEKKSLCLSSLLKYVQEINVMSHNINMEYLISSSVEKRTVWFSVIVFLKWVSRD